MTADAFSTSDHAKSRFVPHGTIRMWTDDVLIHYDVTGPFNLEAIEAFAETVGALLMKWRPKGPFASISYWHESMLASKDALDLYRVLVKSSHDVYPNQLINVWSVPPDIEGRSLMVPIWQSIYDDGGYPLEIVETDAEANERIRWHLENAAK